jgi:phospholipid/cholesterol/gamma-HCH transport system substrate-binding protein
VTKHTNDWLVGGVVLGAMALVVAATMFLQQVDLGSKRPNVTARFREVGNLQIGNGVVIRGVQAGRVEHVELAADGWVIVDLRLEEGITLPPDPVVLVQAATLFGEWQAVITRRESAPPIREVAFQLNDTVMAPVGALPGAVLPDIAQLTSVAGGIAGNVASVAERVRSAFDDTASRDLRNSIRNFNTLSTELSRTVRTQSANMDRVAAEVLVGVADLVAGANALQLSIARIDSATSQGEIQSIIADADLAAQNVREAAVRINALTVSLERSEVSIRSVLVRADTLFSRLESGRGSLGLLLNDPSLYRNSDSLMIDLRSLIADLKQNPKRYLNLSIF